MLSKNAICPQETHFSLQLKFTNLKMSTLDVTTIKLPSSSEVVGCVGKMIFRVNGHRRSIQQTFGQDLPLLLFHGCVSCF